MKICKNSSNSIYLDNASTTFIDPHVVEAMMPYLTSISGNPSSPHKEGRKAKVAIDNARDQIAEILFAQPSEIFFTSGGTESNNTALWGACRSLKIKNIITSKLEHDSVYETIKSISTNLNIPTHYIRNDSAGRLDLDELELKLKSLQGPSLVSLMHANNEIGNINDIYEISNICKKYSAFFHCDTVQTVGKMDINFEKTNIDFASASAHKFHGPKGIGLLYINGNAKIAPLIVGGSQERNMRSGTENVAAIVGMAKALELATNDNSNRSTHCLKLKKKLIHEIKHNCYDFVKFNGLSGDLEHSLPNIANLEVDFQDEENIILYGIDAAEICVSAGSACSSGVAKSSRIITELNPTIKNPSIRISFSYQNTDEEIEKLISTIRKICTK